MKPAFAAADPMLTALTTSPSGVCCSASPGRPFAFLSMVRQSGTKPTNAESDAEDENGRDTDKDGGNDGSMFPGFNSSIIA